MKDVMKGEELNDGSSSFAGATNSGNLSSSTTSLLAPPLGSSTLSSTLSASSSRVGTISPLEEPLYLPSAVSPYTQSLPSQEMVLSTKPPFNICNYLYLIFTILGIVVVLTLIFVLSLADERPYLIGFAFLAMLPALIIILLLYFLHHRKKVHVDRMAKFFSLGVLGSFPVIVVEVLLLTSGELILEAYNPETDKDRMFVIVFAAFFSAFVVAAGVEETLKYFLARGVVIRPERDTPYGVLLLSLAGALGIATLENVGYVVGAGIQYGAKEAFNTVIARGLLSIPLHAATGVIIGADVAKAKFSTERRSALSILFIPILLHGTYDFLIIFGESYYDNFGEGEVLLLLLFVPVLVVTAVVLAWEKGRKVLELEEAAFAKKLYDGLFSV